MNDGPCHHNPSKFFSALKSNCSRLSVVLLSYDSRSTLFRLDRRKKFGRDDDAKIFLSHLELLVCRAGKKKQLPGARASKGCQLLRAGRSIYHSYSYCLFLSNARIQKWASRSPDCLKRLLTKESVRIHFILVQDSGQSGLAITVSIGSDLVDEVWNV